MSKELNTVRFIGYTYVLESKQDGSFCVCIDSEDTTGIVLMFFASQDEANARAASRALNIWAGMDVAEEKPLLVIRQ